MLRSSPIILALIALLTGCAIDEANRYYSSQKFPAKAPAEVEILKVPPAREYEVIADFQARNISPEAMRKRAAAIGADAVIVQTLGGMYSLNDTWVGKDSQQSTYTRITGSAIKYR